MGSRWQASPEPPKPKSRRANLITMRSIALVLLCAGTLFAASDMIGHRAPGFSLLTGEPVPRSAGLSRQNPDRGVHADHLPALRRLLQDPGGSRVQVRRQGFHLSIVNPPDTPDKVASTSPPTKSRIPILFDCGQIAASYVHWMPGKAGGFDLPRVFIIDAGGRNPAGSGI